MQAVKKITSVYGLFHQFGCLVDLTVVEQLDGTYISSPWYVSQVFVDEQYINGSKGIFIMAWLDSSHVIDVFHILFILFVVQICFCLSFVTLTKLILN